MNSILNVVDVTKRYDQQTALDHVSISIPENSVFGLLGPNGAGKTSLIRIINQITAPDSGSILFQNEPLSPKHAELIGYLPEERGLYKKMEIGEQAIYLARLKGLSRAEAVKRLKSWFEKFEIKGWWRKKVEDLSKGMQQKVQFIVTVIHKPRLLILDEPFTGFDPINAQLIRDELLEMKANGTTIILSTHRLESVEELCTHICLINKSKSVLEGSVKDIRKSFSSRTYEVLFEASGQPYEFDMNDSQVELLQEENHETMITYRIRLKSGFSSNELLSSFIKKGTIHGFREMIPSMNEIFIQSVNTASQNQLHG